MMAVPLHGLIGSFSGRGPSLYRTIETGMWDDPKVSSLDRDGKLLFVYLFSNRHSHVSGIYYLPSVLVEHELRFKKSTVDTLWHTLSELGLAIFDHKLEVVWVKKMFFYQGRGEKNCISAANHLLTLHKSYLINNFLGEYPAVRKYVKSPLKDSLDTLSDRISEVGVQEQEQNQEQLQNQKTTNPLSESKDSDVKAVAVNGAKSYDESWLHEEWPSVRKFVAMHNTLTHESWPIVRKLDQTRIDKIKKYLKWFPEEDFWGRVFKETHTGSFLQTYRNRGMDWLLTKGQDKTANCLKVWEGKYRGDGK